MKITRDGSSRLVISELQIVWPLVFAMFGGLIFYLGCAMMRKGHAELMGALLMCAVGGLFCLFGILCCRRVEFVFDQLQQQVSWRRIGVLGAKSGKVPFSQIRWAFVEFSTSLESGAKENTSRLCLRLQEGSLPFSDVYVGASARKWERGRDAINEFLGRTPEEEPPASPEEEIRQLVQSGHVITAIKRVRESRGCSLAEAKRIVDGMRS